MNLGGTVHITKTGLCVLVACLILTTIYVLPIKDSFLFKTSGEQVSLNHLLSAAIQAAENGGREVVKLLDTIEISSKGKTKEGANDSVTTADFHSHCIMLSSIKSNFPRIDIISEEEVVCDTNAKTPNINLTLTNLKDHYVDEKDVKIWIDPLDATQEYTEKLTKYVTTMVCIAVKGKPVIGVIHKPFEKTTFWAWVGHGHSDNLITKNVQTNDKFRFIVSRSHMGDVRSAIQKMFKDTTGEIITAGGAGYKVLEVVNGNADIYLHVTAIKKWDICAGNAILNAVGGTMTTLKGSEIDYADGENAKNEDGIIARSLQFEKIDLE